MRPLLRLICWDAEPSRLHPGLPAKSLPRGPPAPPIKQPPLYSFFQYDAARTLKVTCFLFAILLAVANCKYQLLVVLSTR